MHSNSRKRDPDQYPQREARPAMLTVIQCVGVEPLPNDRINTKVATKTLLFAAVSKLTLLTIIFTLSLAAAPTVGAAPLPLTQGSDCDSNYGGACVPTARDVDCAGGSGNGPEYVSGPVYVVGDDIYDLDHDGDGVACEN